MKRYSIMKNIHYYVMGILFFLIGILAIFSEMKLGKTQADLIQENVFMYILCENILIIAGIGFIIIGVWILYRALHIVYIDEEGVKSSFFGNIIQSLNWYEINEWGIAWQYCFPDKCYHSLFDNEERFWKEKNMNTGKKYIYFSTKPLSGEEKERILSESSHRNGLLVIPYSLKIYQKVFDMQRKMNLSNDSYDSRIIEEMEVDISKPYTCFMDFSGGMSSFLIMLIMGYICFELTEEIMQYNTAIIRVLYNIWLVWYISRFFQKVTVEKNSVTCQGIFQSKKIWKWEEVHECAALRNYSKSLRERYYTEERYIFFSKVSFSELKKMGDSFWRKYLKSEDIIMVKYTEELYWYLKKLGVLGIKEQ